MTKFGYSKGWSLRHSGLRTSAGAIDGISGVGANACATLWLPTGILISTSSGADGPHKAIDGSVDVPLSKDL
jgi:formamidase